MKQHNRRILWTALALLAAFALWTAAVGRMDVRPMGPQGTAVGFAALNGWSHNLTGVHMWLYTLTDWLSLIPLGVAVGFAALGLAQWIRRKHVLRVDRSILVLGGFYAAVLAVYLLFERCAVNYRPVLIEGVLEASYPSSTTVLVMFILPTAVMQWKTRIKNEQLRRRISFAGTVFAAGMVIGRLVSGVHWLTDIVGGALLSTGLVLLYAFFAE